MVLQFRGRVGTGQQVLDGDVRDLQIVTLSSGTYLYSTTGANGGISAYALGGGALAEWEDSLYFGSISPDLISGSLSLLPSEGGGILVFGGADSLQGVSLGADGMLGGRVETGGLNSGTETICAIATVSLSTGVAVYVADIGTGSLITYAVDNGTSIRQSGSSVPGLTGTVAMTSVTVSGRTLLLAADQGAQGVSSFRVDTNTGALSVGDTMGAGQGLGVADPTAMEVIQAFGATWVILAAAGSSSLSVMQVSSSGELTPTDHVIDTLHTRFGGVQSLAVTEVDGQVFVVAGGADDGLSLFTLLPDGRLVHLQSLAHSEGRGLMDVTQIAAQRVGDEIQIFVASEDTAGLSQFSVSLANLGITQTGGAGGAGNDLLISTGDDTLIGWGGNDILVAGPGDTVMTGGTGADIFVLATGGHSATITDFDPANDRLDLSDWPMLRDPAQLTITPTRTGAVITFRDNSLTIHTASGQPLSDIGAWFTTPDRVLVLGQPTGQALTGSRGNDILSSDEGHDTIDAGGGHDEVWSYGGDDLIYGGWGHDLIWAGADDDTVWAAGGDDTIYGGSGDDTLGGGDGEDMLWGGDGNDLQFGDLDNDTLGGAAGDDTLWAGGGNDLIFGDLGNDEMGGGLGADRVWAGPGDDLIYGGEGWDSLGGGTGNDTIWADAGNDLAFGGDGNDLIAGSLGADTIWAGQGQDTIYGGDDNDLMGGGGGRDTIYGGRGNDTLSGGVEADVFVFARNDGTDRITDFTPGQDQIRIVNGPTGFWALSLSATAEGVWVGYGSGSILLEGLSLSDLGASDFLFT